MISFQQIYQICAPFTITSLKRMERLYASVVYINENNIEGAYVECGVYKGGVLILDDYLYWRGARKATDDYFFSAGITPKFEPLESDVSGVIFVKKE